MFEFYAKYLATGQLKFKEGEIDLLRERMLFLPTNVLVKVQQAVAKDKGEFYGIPLYSMFKEGGKAYAPAVRDQVGLNGGEIAKWMGTASTASGWGSIKLVDYNNEKSRGIFEVVNSPFIQHFPPPNPCCHIIRGLIAGTLETLFGKGIDGIEKSCGVSTGSKCLMIFQPSEDWLNTNDPQSKELMKHQLDLKALD